MARYGLDFSIEADGPCDVECRAWIDSTQGSSLHSEFEVKLRRLANRWHGAFQLPPRAGSAFYRVGIVAPVGATWSFAIRDLSRSLELLRDGDEITEPKVWLLGSWRTGNSAEVVLPNTARRDSAIVLTTDRSTPTRHLVLAIHGRASSA